MLGIPGIIPIPPLGPLGQAPFMLRQPITGSPEPMMQREISWDFHGISWMHGFSQNSMAFTEAKKYLSNSVGMEFVWFDA